MQNGELSEQAKFYVGVQLKRGKSGGTKDLEIADIL